MQSDRLPRLRWPVTRSWHSCLMLLLAKHSLCMSADATQAKEPYKYEFKQQEDPFSFEILRPGPGHYGQPPIWNITGHRLIFKEQYLEISSWAPAGSSMYGLGERISTSGEGLVPVIEPL